MAAWSYIAQRVLTGEFLDFDVPLTRDELSWSLSGAGSLRGTITPDRGRLRAADGRLLFEEWGTLLYAEADGLIRWGGILISSSFNGEVWSVEAAGFATYPNGLPYDNARSWTQVDPVVPFRELWANAQYRPNARLGVRVVAGETPVRLGDRGTGDNNEALSVGDVSDEKWASLIADDGWFVGGDGRLYPPQRLFRDRIGTAEFDRLVAAGWRAEKVVHVSAGDTEVPLEGKEQYDIDFLTSYGWRTGVNSRGERVMTGPAWVEPRPRWVDPPLVKVDPAPYALSWWETPDIGAKLDELTKQTPFDYVERHSWVPGDLIVDATTTDPDMVDWMRGNGWTSNPGDGAELLYRPSRSPVSVEAAAVSQSERSRLVAAGWRADPDDGAERLYAPADTAVIAHIIRVHYPRVGRRRDDLAFVQGDNIIDVVSPAFDGDDYANSITGLGAGEGIAAVRREMSVTDGRLYRSYVYTDKSITDPAVLTSRMQTELAWRQRLMEISSITVRDHSYARIGDWSLGDDILVEADLPWLGAVQLWCRVTGWSLVTDDTATLTLARSDSFTYGR